MARGTIELDAPVARYLPDLVPGERGRQITVRMLLNHTSHIGDYIGGAFPSLLEGSTASLDDHRFRTIKPEKLVELGLAATPTGTPGIAPGSYSNTNYIVAGLLLEKVTGIKAETYVTRNVIRKAGLHHTSFPSTPHIPGPHSKAYESCSASSTRHATTASTTCRGRARRVPWCRPWTTSTASTGRC